MDNLKVYFNSVEERRRIEDILIAIGFKPVSLVRANNGFFLAANGIFSSYSALNTHPDFYKEFGILDIESALNQVKTKEYLDSDFILRNVKQTSGDNRVPSDWIEVPEGAEFLYKFRWDNGTSCKQFFKDNCMSFYSVGIGAWKQSGSIVRHNSNAFLVWQHPTLSEELPFIDDEPPAYYGNAIRKKPRQRVYAVIGGDV